MGLRAAFVSAVAAVLAIIFRCIGIADVNIDCFNRFGKDSIKHHWLTQAAAGDMLTVLIVVAVFYPISINP